MFIFIYFSYLFPPLCSIIILCFCGLRVTPGDGGGGDGSSGSEESGNDGGVSTIPLPSTNVQTTYDALRGLGIVGSSAAAEDHDSNASDLPGRGRNSLSLLTEVGGKQNCMRDLLLL